MAKWRECIPPNERTDFLGRYNKMSVEERRQAREKYVVMQRERQMAASIAAAGVSTKAELDVVKAERKRLRRERLLASKHNKHMCVYIPHPTRLREAVCAICQIQRPESMKTVFYNKIRRQYKASMSLWSLCAPLAGESHAALNDFVRRNSLETNTSMFHVTIVEGIYQARTISESWTKMDYMYQVHDRLRQESSQHRLRVTDLQAVQTRRDDMKALIIVQLEWDYPTAAEAVVEDLVKSCWCCDSLPQWPLHCALGVIHIPCSGTTKKKKKKKYDMPETWEQFEMIKQQFLREHETLHLNMSRLCELPPPQLEESESQTRMARALSTSTSFSLKPFESEPP